MVVNIDGNLDDATEKRIADINGICTAKYIKLKGKI